MDFGLTDEQKLLEQTLRRLLGEVAPPLRVREIMNGETAHDPKLWAQLAELGVAGILVPEAQGGGGLQMLDAALAMQSLGHGATPAPFLATSVLAPVALAAGTPAQQGEWLPRIAAGDALLGVAASELVCKRADAGVRVESGRLQGKAYFVLDAGVAQAFLVAVDRDRIALVPRDAAGLGVTLLTTIDRTRRVAELVFEGTTPAEWIGGRDGVPGIANRLLAAGRIALAADILGACERAVEMAVAYAKQREQFGRTIATFQAVKHLCAEMVAELEPARSLLWYAAYAFDERPEEAPLLALHAKAHFAEIGTFIVRTATEVHGGIGFTDAYDLQLWFKRVGLDRQLLGTPELLRAEAATLQFG
ncbi:MAG: acyl-CoA dehydrogenase [Deltaproteobacteria bacterium]|nr:acyl-CoA dehydrogenase [Deltaproteobacteria bacterium]